MYTCNPGSRLLRRRPSLVSTIKAAVLQLEFLANTTSVSRLRLYVRNRFRMTSHLFKKKGNGGIFCICNQSMYEVFPSITTNDIIVKSMCCKREIYIRDVMWTRRHVRCVTKSLPACPVCSVATDSIMREHFTGCMRPMARAGLLRHSLSYLIFNFSVPDCRAAKLMCVLPVTSGHNRVTVHAVIPRLPDGW